ncbi:N-(5'-phosphoribosyl) anthranilate isomerase [Erythrobacter sp. NAP1]|uniref:phosphoribosylanthranilate isomerase n=1 Tax=Erythrobacter sp. NAP1 TaxID=237727 RepID=UPI0000686B1B|nr:phosphoribosylanthranilate isomerase [Erythrobacter sp. NAP1]EAQ30475.1 N-(5'-phosphoribosyl) anthranilate isomerase [Erythrobacter sp. NAP1]
MTIQIKICGLSTPETIAASADAGASHIGFNFYPPSPRSVAPELASELAAITPRSLLKVGVFVNPDDTLLNEAVRHGALDAIQLHGKETPARVQEVKASFGLPVWKVLSVETDEDIAAADAYSSVADLILFDTKTPKGALPGGMGMGFDWSLLDAFDKSIPWGLAGGLNSENVADAIRATGAPLVDTSSGVESAPGVKDVDRIAAFCKAALDHD